LYLLEYLPLSIVFKKVNGKWVKVRTLNKRQRRHVPSGAVVHWTLLERLKAVPEYKPDNEGLAAAIENTENGDKALDVGEKQARNGQAEQDD
jgi:ribosomal protein S12 methylthiotransferase accessory factor YcaO